MAMDHLLSLVNDRVGVIAVVLLAVSAVSAAWIGHQRGRLVGSQWLAALAASVVIVSMTLTNRGLVVSQAGMGRDLTWWARNWPALPGAIGDDPGWWLNVVLFVPAGAAWTWLTGRPVAATLALTIASIVVETLHATVLSGAGDPADLVANSIGAASGSWLATRLMLRRDGTLDRQQPSAPRCERRA